jgi:hypothetical protein
MSVIDKIIGLYKEGTPIEEISTMLQLTYYTVTQVLMKAGFEL